MEATNLAPALWNAIAEMVRKESTVPREVFFSAITKVDSESRLIYTDEFGDIAVPLVGFKLGFSTYDTQPDGVLVKRGEDYEMNDAYQNRLIMPSVGEIAVIIDPEGARVHPFCVGVVQSGTGYWEGSSGT